tara:strand:+ start:257 stop:364 length:108 start_codon:yes stop_codon:yes gene_type:complete
MSHTLGNILTTMTQAVILMHVMVKTLIIVKLRHAI